MGQPAIQAAHKVYLAAGVAGFPVSHYPVNGKVKVVQHHRAAEPQAGLGGRFKAGKFRIQLGLHIGVAVALAGHVFDVVLAGVNVDHIRGKCGQAAVVKHQVFVEQAVTALPEGGLNAIGQQKDFQNVFYFTDGAAAEQRHLFGYKARRLQQLALQAALFLQNGSGIQGIGEQIHGKPPDFNEFYP